MGDLGRDVARLNLILELSIGQENLQPLSQARDFATYYFTRFWSNLTSIFKDFSTSEITDYERKHHSQITHLLKYPSWNMTGVILPIPKGMVGSYRQTLLSLLEVLSIAKPKMLLGDLQNLQQAIQRKNLSTLTDTPCDKSDFEQAKGMISKLFGKTGLTHATAPYVLATQGDVREVLTGLTDLTEQYYPEILKLQKLIPAIEDVHKKATWSGKDKAILSAQLMTLAYRLSIFATVMEHVQDVEHRFVMSLDTLIHSLP